MKTLLLVDPEPRSRRRLYSLLQRRGEVRAVHSVFTAFQFLRHKRPDMIIVSASECDALAVSLLKWLGQHRLGIPTLVLVGARRDGESLHRLGASQILRWPESDAEVLHAVASLNGRASHEVKRGESIPGPVLAFRRSTPAIEKTQGIC